MYVPPSIRHCYPRMKAILHSPIATTSIGLRTTLSHSAVAGCGSIDASSRIRSLARRACEMVQPRAVHISRSSQAGSLDGSHRVARSRSRQDSGRRSCVALHSVDGHGHWCVLLAGNTLRGGDARCASASCVSALRPPQRNARMRSALLRESHWFLSQPSGPAYIPRLGDDIASGEFFNARLRKANPLNARRVLLAAARRSSYEELCMHRYTV